MPSIPTNSAGSAGTSVDDNFISTVADLTAGVGTISISASSTAITGVGTAFVPADVGKVIVVGVGGTAKQFIVSAVASATAATAANANDLVAVAAAAFTVGWFDAYQRLIRVATTSNGITSTQWRNQSTGYTIPLAASPIVGVNAQLAVPGSVISISPSDITATADVVGVGTVAMAASSTTITGTTTAFSASDVGKIITIGAKSFVVATFVSATNITTTIANDITAIPALSTYTLSAVSQVTKSHRNSNYATVVNTGLTDVYMELNSGTTHPTGISRKVGSTTLNGLELNTAVFRAIGTGEVYTLDIAEGFFV